jgi:hypothetical protein|tara:strand:+ start:175 stop:306 length:132 start_codon:yes stop_codon:yes gene_type:complete
MNDVLFSNRWVAVLGSLAFFLRIEGANNLKPLAGDVSPYLIPE